MESDLQIQQDVQDELKLDPRIDPSRVGVAVKDGIVSLAGQVPSFTAKWAAVAAAKRVYRVTGVADELTVKLPSNAERTDVDIAAAAVAALAWHTEVPDHRIKITVERGHITLDGNVEYQYQKVGADSAVRHLTGVRGVTNLVNVAARVTPVDVKAEIRKAFQRNAELDVRRVGVKTHDGRVVLHGNVHSWMEHDEAQRAAWSIPGVREVENELTVTP